MLSLRGFCSEPSLNTRSNCMQSVKRITFHILNIDVLLHLYALFDFFLYYGRNVTKFCFEYCDLIVFRFMNYICLFTNYEENWVGRKKI